MSANMNIRRSEAKDTAAIGDLIVDIQRHEFGFPITLDDQPDLADIDGFYRTGDGDFWLAESGEEVVGTIALVDIGDGQAALRKMFVKTGFRGQQTGVAKNLLDALLDHARMQRFSTIVLGTTPKFLAAHRFYEKNGFVRVDVETLPASFPRMGVDECFYQLDL